MATHDLSVDAERLSLAATLLEAQRRRVQKLPVGSRSRVEAEALLATFECSLDAIEQRRAARREDSCRRFANRYPAAPANIQEWSPGSPERDAIVLQMQTAPGRERNEIAQVLHDELGQELALLKAQIFNLASASQEQSPEHASAMRDLQVRIDTAISSVRRITFAVHAQALDGQDLAVAIQALASEYSSLSGLAVRCQIRVETGSFSETASTAIYRIVQEALTNTARHAHARHASVELYRFRDVYVLRLQDDGVGTAPDAPLGVHSLGLRGMRERVRLLNGRFRLETSTGNGFTIAIQLPASSLLETPQTGH